MKRFEVLDHAADIGIIVHGEDLKTLFENAGEAFFHHITDLRKVRPQKEGKTGKSTSHLMGDS